MLELQYTNGGAFVFNADDWETIRTKYRIMGTLIGDTSRGPTLPLKLLPEEALLLLDMKIAKLVEEDCKQINVATYSNFEEELHQQEQILYRKRRQKQLTEIGGKIVEAKKRKGDTRTSDEILSEELEKSSGISKKQMLYPILLRPLERGPCIETPREALLQDTTPGKYQIFKDLWEKGYYITSGHKFGADFLVYIGDPMAYHAIFTVHCIDGPIHSTDIVAFGRLATSVKKRAVLANWNEKVSYLTLNWTE